MIHVEIHNVTQIVTIHNYEGISTTMSSVGTLQQIRGFSIN